MWFPKPRWDQLRVFTNICIVLIFVPNNRIKAPLQLKVPNCMECGNKTSHIYTQSQTKSSAHT